MLKAPVVGRRKDIRRSRFECRSTRWSVKLGTLHLNVRKVHRSTPIILMLFEICGINAPAGRRKCTQQTPLCSHRAGQFQYASLAGLAAAWWPSQHHLIALAKIAASLFVC
jgi:hypothetical protein